MVALLAEGVDRNTSFQWSLSILKVALLAEGVDRNWQVDGTTGRLERVALLAEGVDRNCGRKLYHEALVSRPPRGGRG